MRQELDNKLATIKAETKEALKIKASECDKYQKEITSLARTIKQNERTITNLSEELESFREILNECSIDSSQEMLKRFKDLKNQETVLKDQMDSLKQKVSDASGRIEELEEAKKVLECEVEGLRLASADHESAVAKMTDRLSRCQLDLEGVKVERDILQDTHCDRLKEVSALKVCVLEYPLLMNSFNLVRNTPRPQ